MEEVTQEQVNVAFKEWIKAMEGLNEVLKQKVEKEEVKLVAMRSLYEVLYKSNITN